jgi:hypothetical protein
MTKNILMASGGFYSLILNRSKMLCHTLNIEHCGLKGKKALRQPTDKYTHVVTSFMSLPRYKGGFGFIFDQ